MTTARYVLGTSRMGTRDWYYDYSLIPATFTPQEIERVQTSLLVRFARLTKMWTPQLNSEWTVRTYFSAKLILAATLAINSLKYAEERNLRVVMPYLRYYAVLSALRSIVYTIPEAEWNSGELLQLSHAKVINKAIAHISAFNKNKGTELKSKILRLKAERELISYRAPSSGDWNTKAETDQVIELCRLLAEVAQFNSELLESSIEKNADPSTFTILAEFAAIVDSTVLEGLTFVDSEDSYRFGYMARKHPVPANLRHTMTEGHTESFFGAWTSESEIADPFDADDDWEVIFNIT